MKDKILARFATLRQRVRNHTSWLWGGSFALVVVVCALVVGRTAHARAAALGERVHRLEASLKAYDRWAHGFRPAAAAESTAWLETEQAVRELGLTLSTRVALAELIARRAEDIGIPDVSVRTQGTDTIAFEPLTAGSARFELSPLAYAIEMTGDANAVSELLRVLPPHVEARQIRIDRAADSSRARILLITYSNPDEASDAI